MKTYEGYGSTIELHDDHLVIRQEGKLARAAGLGGTREIPLAAVAKVALKQAPLIGTGYLQLQLGGVPPRDPIGDPNTVFFRRRNETEFEELEQFLKQRVSEFQEAGIDPASVDVDLGGASRVDRLRAKAVEAKDAAAERRAAAAERAEEARFEGKFNKVTLRGGQIDSPWGGGPVAGARFPATARGRAGRLGIEDPGYELPLDVDAQAKRGPGRYSGSQKEPIPPATWFELRTHKRRIVPALVARHVGSGERRGPGRWGAPAGPARR